MVLRVSDAPPTRQGFLDQFLALGIVEFAGDLSARFRNSL
jgi:hypothetical protein